MTDLDVSIDENSDFSTEEKSFSNTLSRVENERNLDVRTQVNNLGRKSDHIVNVNIPPGNKNVFTNINSNILKMMETLSGVCKRQDSGEQILVCLRDRQMRSENLLSSLKHNVDLVNGRFDIVEGRIKSFDSNIDRFDNNLNSLYSELSEYKKTSVENTGRTQAIASQIDGMKNVSRVNDKNSQELEAVKNSLRDVHENLKGASTSFSQNREYLAELTSRMQKTESLVREKYDMLEKLSSEKSSEISENRENLEILKLEISKSIAEDKKKLEKIPTLPGSL